MKSRLDSLSPDALNAERNSWSSMEALKLKVMTGSCVPHPETRDASKSSGIKSEIKPKTMLQMPCATCSGVAASIRSEATVMTDSLKETQDEQHDALNAITPEFASAVGYVTMYWSALEMQIFLTLAQITGTDSAVASIFTAEASLLQKLDIITALIHYSRRGDWFDEWCALEQRINHLRVKRNDVAHGLWQADKDLKHTLTRIKSRRKLSVSTGLADISQIANLYEAIAECYNLFVDFSFRLTAGQFSEVIKSPTGPSLSDVKSPKYFAQDQARAQKQARKLADRALFESRKAQPTQTEDGGFGGAGTAPPTFP